MSGFIHANIEIYTHFFAVLPKSPQMNPVIFSFLNNFIEPEWKYNPATGKQEKVIGKIWAGKTNDFTQHRFPISLLQSFYTHCGRYNINKDNFSVKVAELYEPAKASFTLAEQYKLRDYQEEGVNFALENYKNKVPSSLLMMPTGTGKTVTLLALAARLGLRMGMVISPNYISKWLEDYKNYMNVPKERVYVLTGGKAIIKLFRLAGTDDFDYDVILISLATFLEFMKCYETNPEECVDLYGGTPFEIWMKSKMGFLGGDEVHERFHNVYVLQTFIHGVFHLGLSATLLHKERFIEKMQETIYPRSIRFDKIKLPKYIDYINMSYRLESIEKDNIKFTFPRRSTYSQAAYEHSVLKNRKVKKNFLEMINNVVDYFYISKKKPGQKLAVYFARIEMVKTVCEYLKTKYPDLDIRTYAENDPYENVIEADIRITTVGSAGTGIDIKNLITVISFVNMESHQAVIQLTGRLRDLGEIPTTFVQLYGSNVKKHIQYKNANDILLRDRVKSQSNIHYPTSL